MQACDVHNQIANIDTHRRLKAVYLVVGIVGDVGRAVKEVANAMAAVRSHNLEFVLPHVLADDVPNFPIPHSWPHSLNGFVQRLPSKEIGVTS